jgi:hypothetical protein
MRRRIITAIAAVAMAVSGMTAIGLAGAGLTASPAGADQTVMPDCLGANPPILHPVQPFNFFGAPTTYVTCTPNYFTGNTNVNGTGLQIYYYGCPGDGWCDYWNATAMDVGPNGPRQWAGENGPISGCNYYRGKTVEHVYTNPYGVTPGDYLEYSGVAALCF